MFAIATNSSRNRHLIKLKTKPHSTICETKNILNFFSVKKLQKAPRLAIFSDSLNAFFWKQVMKDIERSQKWLLFYLYNNWKHLWAFDFVRQEIWSSHIRKMVDKICFLLSFFYERFFESVRERIKKKGVERLLFCLVLY